MNINKNTIIYGSFSQEPGNFGCEFHNKGFQALGINAIYKSFEVRDLKNALKAMITLNIKGAGISMPFKTQIVDCIKSLIKSGDAKSIIPNIGGTIGSINTVLNYNGHFVLHNTDYLAVKEYFETNLELDKLDHIFILGDGGYSKAVQYALSLLKINFSIVSRRKYNWHLTKTINESWVFNCTPLSRNQIDIGNDNTYIDCLVSTETGKTLAYLQAAEQFKLYTGKEYPYDHEYRRYDGSIQRFEPCRV